MQYRLIIFSLIFCFYGFNVVFAQMVFDARRLSMAGSNIAITEGNEYFGANPATLAQIHDFNFELHLVSAHFMVNNNSYSLNEYNKYFTDGDSLTSQDIEELLSTMPEKGLKGNFNLGAKALSFYARPFSITLGGIGNGFLNVPKDVFNLPLLGNTVVKEYSFDNLEGEAWSAGLVEFAIGFPITQWIPSQFNFASVGLSARYLVGIDYANIEDASGNIFTTDDYLLANGHAEIRTSSGGSGYGIDLGILGLYEENWTFSLHFNNILGSMYWSKNDSMRFVDFRSDSLLRLDDVDDLAVVDEDTTFAIDNFRTGLPRAVTLAAAYQFQPNLVLTAAFRQGLNKSLGNTTDPHFSLGAEYTPVHFLPLRGGFSIGGESNFTLGLGLGVDLKYWQLNLAYLNHNFRWFKGARSMDLALSMLFRF